MQRTSVEAVVGALNASGLRFLIAGGLAVVAHGHVRFTADIDLILDLDSPSLKDGLAALEALGYKPRAPVPIADFANPTRRRSWIEEKGLTVFSLHSPVHPATELDIFVSAPFEFGPAYSAAKVHEIASGLPARFVDLERLLEMKRKAGRPRDAEDIAALERLRKGDS